MTSSPAGELMTQSRLLRRGLLVWLVALVALLPFLHAHAYGDGGAAAGFLHVHLVADGAGPGAAATEGELAGETFVAQDGQRLQQPAPVTACAKRTGATPSTARGIAWPPRADRVVVATTLLAAEPRAPPAA
jgi:hypothetical protein